MYLVILVKMRISTKWLITTFCTGVVFVPFKGHPRNTSQVHLIEKRVMLKENRNLLSLLKYACVYAMSCQSPVIPCDPMDCSPPGSSWFFRQEYWSVLPCPPPEDLPDSGIEPLSPGLLHCRRILYCLVTREAHLKIYLDTNLILMSPN